METNHMNIQWYPGHMTKAKRAMQEDIELIDLIIELVDARAPLSSRNPALDEMIRHKRRVLLLCKGEKMPSDKEIGALCLIGGVCFCDPVRTDAPHAVHTLQQAGVQVVMLTGDHIKTASAVAKLAGIPNAQQAMTGAELDTLSEEALSEVLEQYAVFARVTPAHKLRLVRAYRAKGKIVTMTGDGVNDAPAVKEADIGVAMGKNGTDVTRQAADVVLMDDDPRKIALAIRIARQCLAIVRQNIVFALGVKALCLLLVALGFADMWLGIFADVGVMVLAVLNAMRALHAGKEA